MEALDPLPEPLILLGLLRVQASFCSKTQYKLHVGRLGVPAGGLRPFCRMVLAFSSLFELELKLAKCGLKACGGCKIGLVS